MKLKYTTCLLSMMLMFAASCSTDDVDSPVAEDAHVGVRIGSRAATDPGTPEGPVGDCEKINSYKVIFVDQSRVIKAVVSSQCSPAVEEDVLNVTLPTGTYSVYAVANITDFSKIADESVKEFWQSAAAGAKAPGHADIVGAVWQGMGNGLDAGQHIPMSGCRTGMKVTGRVEESFSIEVVRMLAKMEVRFKTHDDLADDVTLTGVALKYGHKGDIPMMPDDEVHGIKAPTMLAGVATEQLTIYSGTATVGANGFTTPAYYLRESVATHPSGCYLLEVKTRRGNEAEETVQYVMTDELQYINRNDHIFIPITVTGFVLDPQVLFYPPIGGYPDAELTGEGDNYYAAFGTQGKFVINMLVRKAQNSLEYLPQSQVETKIEVVDGLSIFTQAPAVDELTGEIIGTLSTATGTAKLKVTVTVHYTADNKAKTLVYNRYLYIIRK